MSIQYSGDKITFSDGSTVGSGWTGMKNRIINGNMAINQRGSSTTSNGYTLDRWNAYVIAGSKMTVQQSSDAPTGFGNSLLVTSSTALTPANNNYYNIQQCIEGFNTVDLLFGSASAKTVTISFWVKSSLTGTFGGSLMNSAENRSYPFTYTISAANTWEQRSVSITGDTTGTWVGATNGIGMRLCFGLTHGPDYQATANAWTSGYKFPSGAVNILETNGATFYITGVQLEKGSTATSFDYRPYGAELVLCQRYCQVYLPSVQELIYNESSGATNKFWGFPVSPVFRTTPSVSFSSGLTGGTVVGLSGTVSSVTLESANGSGRIALRVNMSTSSGTAYTMNHCDSFNLDPITVSAEL